MKIVKSRKDCVGKSSVYSNIKKPRHMGKNLEFKSKNSSFNKHVKKFYSKKRRSNFKQIDSIIMYD